MMWSADTDVGPPAVAQSHSLRDLEQHLSDLKKENFNLKLRIYFLEERVQNQTPELDQDLSKINIELNVQLQSLKKDLEEKEQLLQEALSTAELLSNQSAEEQQRRDEATNQIQKSLEARIQQLQQELHEQQQSESSQQRLQKQALDQKDRVISELTAHKVSLEQKVQELSSALRNTPLSEQNDGVCEKTTERCLTELHRAQNQVHTLQTKIRISEDRNKLLQNRLGEMERELRDVREEAQNQERNLQHLQDSLLCKDQEVSDLHRVMEEQNRALCSLKEAAIRQFSSSPACGVSELQMLLQQKNAVDRELHELKTQLHKTGFSSLSQIRKSLLELKTQNQDLKQQLSQQQEQGAETAEESDQWEGWDSQLTFDQTQGDARTEDTVKVQDSPLHRGGAVDQGYETCERSETEAERDTSSPEFDDLELCVSLDHSSHWWTPQNLDPKPGQDRDLGLHPDSATNKQIQELQRLVHHLKSELNHSRNQVHRLQTESKAESELEPDLADLLSRVKSLENQFKTDSKSERQADTQSGFLGLVHLQARELSRLRQVLRESRGLVQILVQVQTEQLKGLEALLVSREPDYDLGQRLRKELKESHELLLRLSQKISLKDLPEEPDDKTELLAMRLSKELQQKDLLIESLRSKLRSNTPTDSTDQSDRMSYVSDGQLSNQDEDLGSESNSELQLDQSRSSDQTSGQSERSGVYNGQSDQSGVYNSQSERRGVYYSQSEVSGTYSSQLKQSGASRDQSASFYSHAAPTDPRSVFSSVPPSVTSSHSFPMMHCSPGHAPSGGAALRPLQPRPIVALSQPGFTSSSLDSGLRPGLWDTPLSRPITDQRSPATSSLHSLSDALPGAELLAEHLSEVRSLRRRLEESIHTNERLRAHLETRLDPPTAAAPTNIYIQGTDSTETRVLRETSASLKERLQDSLLEAERLREALLLVQTRLKEAELQGQRWAELSRSSQSEASAQRQEVETLRQEQEQNLEVIHRLELEVRALQRQLRSQSERSMGENRARRKLQFQDCSSDREPSANPDMDQDQDLNSETGLNQDLLQLQKILQDSVDLLQSVDQTLKTRTKPGLSRDCERLRVLLQEAQCLNFRTRKEADRIEPENRQEPQMSQVQLLNSEVLLLRQKLSERDQTLRETTEKIQETNRTNQALEQLVLSQLSRTKDVLKKAKTNLQMSRAEVVVS